LAQRGILRHDWLKERQGVQLPRTRDCSPAPSPISWLSAAPALQRSMTHCGDTAAPRGGLPYVIAQCSSQPLPSFHDPCFELDRRFRRSMASAVARPNAMRLSRPSLSARLPPIRSGGHNSKGKGGYRGTRAGYQSGREVYRVYRCSRLAPVSLGRALSSSTLGRSATWRCGDFAHTEEG